MCHSLASSLAHHSTGCGCRDAALPGPLSSAAARRVHSLLDPRRRAGKLLTFPLNLGVSLSRGFCEQAATREDFQRRCTRALPLPKSADTALTIVLNHTIYPEVCFCLSALYAADCRRILTVFEPVTDDKCEKSLLKKWDHLKSHCQLSVTVAFQGWECVMALTLIILMIIHLHKHYACVYTHTHTHTHIYVHKKEPHFSLHGLLVLQDYGIERGHFYPLSWRVSSFYPSYNVLYFLFFFF